VEKEVEMMLDNDIIEHSRSPWSSAVVLVQKKDGSVRFAIDYRRLNAITKRDVYPLPRIADTLDALGGARHFTSLDMASGFWQIPLSAGDKELTAFSCSQGHFQFKRLPFGLCNAPSAFSRFTDTVL
jgi:hypothetical protein